MMMRSWYDGWHEDEGDGSRNYYAEDGDHEEWYYEPDEVYYDESGECCYDEDGWHEDGATQGLNKDSKMKPPPTPMQLQLNSPCRNTMPARAKASRTNG